MDAICPKCDEIIPSNLCNQSKGLAYCQNCRDYFKLDDHLMRNEHLIKREERFLKTNRPPKSKIAIKQTSTGFTIIAPKGKFPIAARIMMVFMMSALSYAIFKLLAETQDHGRDNYIILVVFSIMVVLLFLSLILKGHSTIISLNQNNIQIKRNRYFLSPYLRSRKTNGLDEINTYYSSDSEGGDHSEIEMTFKDEDKLRWGSSLKTTEQEWLAGELIRIRDELLLDEKVVKNIEHNLLKSKTNPLVLNIPKPSQFKSSKSNVSDYSIVIPKDNTLISALGILFLYFIGFAVFGIVAMGYWGYLPSFEPHKIGKYVFSGFALIVLFALFNYLYSFIYRAEHRVLVSSSEIKVELFPYGIQRSKTRQTKNLIDITRSRDWNCILLKFKNEKDLRVGFSLTKEEIKFVTGRLTSMVDEAKS